MPSILLKVGSAVEPGTITQTFTQPDLEKPVKSASDEVKKTPTSMERGLKSKLHAALKMQLSMPASTRLYS